jgi:hypothetical protein
LADFLKKINRKAVGYKVDFGDLCTVFWNIANFEISSLIDREGQSTRHMGEEEMSFDHFGTGT